MAGSARVVHLAGRFFQTLLATREFDDHAFVARYLSAAERELFFRLRLADQRHSIDLGRRLQADGHDDPDLLRAALLHDVGKSLGPLPLPVRVVYSFCAVARPEIARWLGESERPAWRRPFYLARHHAALGADLARQAGSTPSVAALIAGHEAPGDDRLSRLLYLYDSES